MIEDTIVVLTEMLIKEHCIKKDDRYVISKEELIRFCIKVMKVIEQVYER